MSFTETQERPSHPNRIKVLIGMCLIHRVQGQLLELGGRIKLGYTTSVVGKLSRQL